MKNLLIGALLGFTMTLIFIVTVFATAEETPSPDITGPWHGSLELPGLALTVIVRIEAREDGFIATMDSPDQNASGIPIETVSFDGKTLRLEVKTVFASYLGTYKDGHFTGTWAQGGQKLPLNLDRGLPKDQVVAGITSEEAAKVLGYWQGKLSFGGTELRLGLNISQDENGGLKTTLDSPDQGAQDIPMNETLLEGNLLTVRNKAMAARYEGTLDGDQIKGMWHQGPQSLELNLERGKKTALKPKPQEPKKPYPYRQEEVTFENKEAGIRLAGTLTLPEGDGPFPATVLVSGSGPQDRDEALLGHKPFLVLSDYLTRQGIAVLRYDDRGVADSEGDFQSATSMDFAKDANAAVNFLQKRDDIRKDAIGITGHSEGGLIAPISANTNANVAFAVLMAGPGIPGDEILKMQMRLISEANGAPAEHIERESVVQGQLIDFVKANGKKEGFTDQFDSFLKDLWESLSEKEKNVFGNNFGGFEAQASPFATPWFHTFLTYDPRPNLEQLTIPVLAICGERDLQVPSKENLSEIEKALKKAGNQRFKIVEMPGLNHLFQHDENGSPANYGNIEETFAEDAMKVIADWILETAQSM